jgi:hypothetical protein
MREFIGADNDGFSRRFDRFVEYVSRIVSPENYDAEKSILVALEANVISRAALIVVLEEE